MAPIQFLLSICVIAPELLGRFGNDGVGVMGGEPGHKVCVHVPVVREPAGRVKHLVPAWWQALQPGGLIVHWIIIIVLGNDLFLWFGLEMFEDASLGQAGLQRNGQRHSG